MAANTKAGKAKQSALVDQRSSKSEEPIDFDDEGTVDDRREAVERGVAAIAVHGEQFTAGTIFPAEPRVSAERVVAQKLISSVQSF